MKYYRLPFFVFIGALMISCSADATADFEEVILRLDSYFSEKPILLTSKRVMKDGQEAYAYYALKIVDYDLSYDIHKTFSSHSPYKAVIKISCNTLSNASSGDLVSNILAFQEHAELLPKVPSCFSTADMAMRNAQFSTESKVSFIIRYAYERINWIYNSVDEGGLPRTFLYDLEAFAQNREFRKAIGMRE